MKDNKKYLIIAIFTIAIIFFGGTLAYWQWETSVSQQTSVTFTVDNNFTCSVDGGGDITSSNITLAPASCMNSKYAIKREITTDVEITGSNMSVLMDLWLDINSIDSELKNSTNFKYAITTNENSCTEGYINGGIFTGTTAQLLDNKIYSGSKEEKYYLYVWLDSEETNSDTQGKSFSLSLDGSCISSSYIYQEEILNGADPVLEAGMIPITLSNTGVATTADLGTSWYSYENKEWANAVLVSSTNRANYYESDGVTIKSNQLVADTDILAYYVWIPKYSYKMNGTEQLISISFNSTPTDYNAHPAFNFNGGINGFWVGKFETGHLTLASSTTDNNLGCNETSCENAFGLVIKPNVQSLRYNNVSNMFYASRAMSASGNPYGLDASKINTHMMKNSEWGAVAYLSHSVYGLGSEIYINNSCVYYTGRSGGDVPGSVETRLEFNDGFATEFAYNKTGYYTWIGQPINDDGTFGVVINSNLGTKASTTGNIYGIYDMSGGSYEYVMGRYSSPTTDKSGFTNLQGSEYYDLYSSTIFTGDAYFNINLCTLSTCGGHALNETAGWYNDLNVFVVAGSPWFIRGGSYGNSVAGVFNVDDADGDSSFDKSFRLVIAKGV